MFQSSTRPQPRLTWPATKRATRCSSAMRMASSWKHWPSPDRSSPPVRSSFVWRGAGRREAVIQLPEALRPAIGSIGRARLYGNGLAGPATLRQLSDAAHPHTRTFEARYVLEGRLANAPLGSTISIHIPNGVSAPQLYVPIGALFDAGKGPGVWLVEGETPRVTWRAVQVAGLGDEAASVVGELKAGDRVVALGAHLLHEGEQVRLTGSEAVARVAVKGGE
jgi:multidrug efflux pump subunit AcrA (membrane-fusion protein)